MSGFASGNFETSFSLNCSDVLQQVKSRLPLYHLTEEDIVSKPQFCKLLQSLSQHVDETGLSHVLTERHREVEKEYKQQKQVWLRSEILYRTIKEMLKDFYVGENSGKFSEEDKKFYEVLEQSMIIMECTRCLDPSETTAQEKPLLLNLETQDLLVFRPKQQDFQAMKERLVKEIEIRLMKKCFSVLCYLHPEYMGDSDVLKCAKSSKLPEMLRELKEKVLRENCKLKEQTATLERLSFMYSMVLLNCLSVLHKLARDCRLKVQSEVDQIKTQYLESKCSATFLKLRKEELEILLNTYTPEKIQVHRKIRDTLNEMVAKEEQEKATVSKNVSAYMVLGKEFEELVNEYKHLRLEIENKKWALQEFMKSYE
ncbi:HAUS augmin-like complex subunit 4 [Protopterus annectens]|uniref:HAUS augmin-like complex subunit 4 n=1 Tax=Protopterus annectens TaxID=7888 RepID=UPI001CFB5977|nr:HAUS augmin-like complex subunit 4 [Protopterus annectens]